MIFICLFSLWSKATAHNSMFIFVITINEMKQSAARQERKMLCLEEPEMLSSEEAEMLSHQDEDNLICFVINCVCFRESSPISWFKFLLNWDGMLR